MAHPQIAAFARLADKNAQPIRKIEGQKTLLGRTMHGLTYDEIHDEFTVPQQFAQAILTFAGGAEGETPPLRVIQGSRTRLEAPDRVAVDAVNNEIFVANYLSESITVYARTANGNAAPLRTISGLHGPTGVAVDTINNEIFVANLDDNTITVYARTASGYTSPVRGFLSLGSPTYAIAVDTVNNEIFVNANSVTAVYARTANGFASPLRVISGSSTGISSSTGIAVDTINNEIFVTNSFPPHSLFSPSITVYSRTANGNVAPLRTIMTAAAGIAVDTVNNEIIVTHGSVDVYDRKFRGPLRTISAKSTSFRSPSSIAVDKVNNEIFIGNESLSWGDPTGSLYSICVYAGTANGDVTPSRTITGPSTELFNTPSSITVDTVNDELFVAAGYIIVYARTATGDVAPLRTISGFFTGLVHPNGIAVDTLNNEIFVTDGDGDVSFVNIYARTANEDKAPLRKIFGDSTGLNNPSGIVGSFRS